MTVRFSYCPHRPPTKPDAEKHITEPTDNYLRTFNWNKVRYRADKPIAELIDILQKVS